MDMTPPSDSSSFLLHLSDFPRRPHGAPNTTQCTQKNNPPYTHSAHDSVMWVRMLTFAEGRRWRFFGGCAFPGRLGTALNSRSFGQGLMAVRLST
jgi:hypothetical protein